MTRFRRLSAATICHTSLLPYQLADGRDIVFNRDGKEDGFLLNVAASRLAMSANGGQAVAFYGDCILFGPGELETAENGQDDFPPEMSGMQK